MEKINLLQELEIREYQEDIDWKEYSFNEIIFPPLYKVFQETYKVESYNDENSYSFFVKSENRGFNFGTYIFEFGDIDIILGNFIPPKEVKRIIKEVLEEENENDNLLLNSKVIPIGITNFNEFLVVGYGKENMDKIYVQDLYEQTIVKISENLFEFCRRINLIPEKGNLSCFNDYKELYKNWGGENYWRKRK